MKKLGNKTKIVIVIGAVLGLMIGGSVFNSMAHSTTATRPGPDQTCAFDPSLSKCAPNVDGQCPESFSMNVDEQCFPSGPCPDGYERHDDDETGTCHPIITEEMIDYYPYLCEIILEEENISESMIQACAKNGYEKMVAAEAEEGQQ
jgi:hypothetical protein